MNSTFRGQLALAGLSILLLMPGDLAAYLAGTVSDCRAACAAL
jgi:hypothetical protein